LSVSSSVAVVLQTRFRPAEAVELALAGNCDVPGKGRAGCETYYLLVGEAVDVDSRIFSAVLRVVLVIACEVFRLRLGKGVGQG
jgi:hypothetical protein